MRCLLKHTRLTTTRTHAPLTRLMRCSSTVTIVMLSSSCNFIPPKRRFWKAEPNLSECVFEALFKGVSTLFGLRIVENCFEHTFGKVGSDFQNLRLGSINLDMHIIRLSSSCDFNKTHHHAITMRRRLTHARSFNTTRTHAPKTRLARTPI